MKWYNETVIGCNRSVLQRGISMEQFLMLTLLLRNGDNTVSCTVSGLGNNCCIETYDSNVHSSKPSFRLLFLLCTFPPNWGLIKELSEFQYILFLAFFRVPQYLTTATTASATTTTPHTSPSLPLQLINRLKLQPSFCNRKTTSLEPAAVCLESNFPDNHVWKDNSV